MTTTRYGIKENQVRAFNKMIRVSHQKLNLVCDLVRGLPVERAVDVLKFSKKRVAGEVLKTLLSAVANAEHNKKLPVETLFVKEIWPRRINWVPIVPWNLGGNVVWIFGKLCCQYRAARFLAELAI